MPTTRGKRNAEDDLLPGLEEKKRSRTPKSPSRGGTSKPATKKGKKKTQDKTLPHVILANELLKSGDELRVSRVSGQQFPAPKVWGHRDEPIIDPTEVPDGWNCSETDLADDDIDGQIGRCHRRIDENIMPSIFEDRLEKYQKMKQQQTDMIKSEPQGLSWEVVQRLDILKGVKASFDKQGGDDENTPNVIAIMDAYRSGKLGCHKDQVTCWAHGKMVAGPTKLNVQEFLALNEEHGPRGVWIEGLNNYQPASLYLFYTLPRHPTANGYYMHELVISLRNPATSNINTWEHTLHLEFLEDTGASTMKLHAPDVLQLENISGAPLPISAVTKAGTASGMIDVNMYLLEANIFINGQPLLPFWNTVLASAIREPADAPPQGPQGPRLSGVWIHHVLYCLSMPDNTGEMHIGPNLPEILANVPLCNPALAIPAPI